MQNIKAPILEEFQLFEQQYAQIMQSDNAQLDAALRYLHMRSGKQLRPIMVLLAAKMCYGVSDKSIQTAIAIELLHTASLAHDDVVDQSDTRRGMPSLNAKFGNKAAILVGDYLLAKTIDITAKLRNRKILNIIAQTGQALASGELMQLSLHGGQLTEQQYFDIIRNKTAALFSACMAAGAISAGASPGAINALRTFGLELGTAFQLKDDILDYSDQDIGKPTLSDISDGKVTLPLIIALQRAPKAEANDISSKIEQLLANENASLVLGTSSLGTWHSPLQMTDSNEQILQTIQSFVLRYDGIGYSTKMMDKYKKRATDALSSFHDSPVKSSLLQLLNYSIIRNY